MDREPVHCRLGDQLNANQLLADAVYRKAIEAHVNFVSYSPLKSILHPLQYNRAFHISMYLYNWHQQLCNEMVKEGTNDE